MIRRAIRKIYYSCGLAVRENGLMADRQLDRQLDIEARIEIQTEETAIERRRYRDENEEIGTKGVNRNSSRNINTVERNGQRQNSRKGQSD